MDALGRRHRAPDSVVLATLRAMDVDVDRVEDAPAALESWRAERWGTLAEPVVVVWDGAGGIPVVRVPEERTSAALRIELELEDGTALGQRLMPEDLRPVGRTEIGGRGVVSLELPLPPLPLGYHRLALGSGRRRSESLVISAPMRARPAPREWGVFLPLYALTTRDTWGVGDLSALARLIGWVRELGGGLVATLPLHAGFLDEPFDPSPYSPASRLFWNELYLDVAAVPELERSAEARSLAASRGLRSELRAVRRGELVDVRRVAAAKRRVLELCARELYRRPSRRRDELERFASSDPLLDDYSRFRAAGERHRTGWSVWPEPERSGELGVTEADARFRYHRYAQWLMQGQVDAVLESAGRGSLLLDLPLGVHPDGYDVWREREAFARSARAGAPPDAIFSGGQDWGFPPLHPQRNRSQGYRYSIACIRHIAQHAGVIRIDHVMGLHRLYWIPQGVERSDGLYVHYPAEELYAILTLESERSGAAIVGEDLGTVPRYVRPAMARHGVHRAYVAQYELSEDHGLDRVPPNALASVNTHDMPPFAAFWSGADIDVLVSLGATAPGAAEREREQRARLRRPLVRFLRERGHLSRSAGVESGDVLRGCLDFLASGPAAVVVANLEDLWLETRPQNVPGTTFEHANWRRRAAMTFEQFHRSPEIREALTAIDRARTASVS
ncbi:MAG TPA: 4-alpha-glucanotransferase [Actinomycetota bacterium]|nr:4-alpha-glucanotransferase [Actinomycetota bacterium]